MALNRKRWPRSRGGRDLELFQGLAGGEGFGEPDWAAAAATPGVAVLVAVLGQARTLGGALRLLGGLRRGGLAARAARLSGSAAKQFVRGQPVVLDGFPDSRDDARGLAAANGRSP
jgi:hypothetical protein